MSVNPVTRGLRASALLAGAAVVGSALVTGPVPADDHAPIEHLGAIVERDDHSARRLL